VIGKGFARSGDKIWWLTGAADITGSDNCPGKSDDHFIMVFFVHIWYDYSM
jgi:hypothetical protein